MKIYKDTYRENYYFVPDIVTKFIKNEVDQCIFGIPFALHENKEIDLEVKFFYFPKVYKYEIYKEFFDSSSSAKVEEVSLEYVLSKITPSLQYMIRFIDLSFDSFNMFGPYKYISKEFENILKETLFYQNNKENIERNISYFCSYNFDTAKPSITYKPAKYKDKIFFYRADNFGSRDFYLAEDFYFLNKACLSASVRACIPLSEYELLFLGYKRHCLKKNLYAFINSIIKNKNKFKRFNYKFKIREHLMFFICIYHYLEDGWLDETNS